MEESGTKEYFYHFQFCISDHHAKINVFVQCSVVTYKCLFLCLFEILSSHSRKYPDYRLLRCDTVQSGIQVCPRFWSLPIRLHGVTSHKTVLCLFLVSSNMSEIHKAL